MVSCSRRLSIYHPFLVEWSVTAHPHPYMSSRTRQRFGPPREISMTQFSGRSSLFKTRPGFPPKTFLTASRILGA